MGDDSAAAYRHGKMVRTKEGLGRKQDAWKKDWDEKVLGKKDQKGEKTRAKNDAKWIHLETRELYIRRGENGTDYKWRQDRRASAIDTSDCVAEHFREFCKFVACRFLWNKNCLAMFLINREVKRIVR